jgi:protease-4
MTDTALTQQRFSPYPPEGAPKRRSGWRLLRGAWKLLVAIKDLLALLLLLLFFGLLFAALSARPSAKISDGALLLQLNGAIVEQPAETDGFAALAGDGAPRQFRLREVIHALDQARGDARVKTVVLDLDAFGGGYPAALAEVADALARVRAAGKPVLAYSTGYTDSSYRLAAAASEVWGDPLGGTLFTGPGGTQLFYKGLIDRLGVTAHVYRVGRYKSFVEPYTRTDQSPDSREASQALYGTLFGQWQEGVRRHRPKAQIAEMLARPDQVVIAAGGNIPEANLRAGLIDRIGSRQAFGQRVAQIAGVQANKPAGSFNTIKYDSWLKAKPIPTEGDAIGVLTVAGEIVDGDAPAGTAGGDTVAKAMLDGLATKKLKALVVRVDSPGGSVLASERIRLAVVEAKRRGLPVVVSMGGLAASGGYWIATAGDMIFAQPATITGSIGIFGIIPSFENALGKIGVTADGVRTTPLSGQPDVFRGFSPQLDAVLQAGIENGYRQFIGRVATARKMTPQRVDQIGQGRVWDGGTARQLGLVDRFGSLDDAIAEAARRAKLDPAKVHPVLLEKKPGWAAELARSFESDEEDTSGGDIFARVAGDRRQMLATALGDVARLARGGSIQARCLECGGFGPGTASTSDLSLLTLVWNKLGW